MARWRGSENCVSPTRQMSCRAPCPTNSSRRPDASAASLMSRSRSALFSTLVYPERHVKSNQLDMPSMAPRHGGAWRRREPSHDARRLADVAVSCSQGRRVGPSAGQLSATVPMFACRLRGTTVEDWAKASWFVVFAGLTSCTGPVQIITHQRRRPPFTGRRALESRPPWGLA